MNTTETAPSIATGGAIEVAVAWNDRLQEVVHLETRGRRAREYHVGEDPASDFPVPSDLLAGRTRAPLVEISEGEAAAHVPPGAEAVVRDADGRRLPVAGVCAVAPSAVFPGGISVPILPGAPVEVSLGPWRFRLRATSPPGRYRAPVAIAWTPNAFAGVSLLLHAAFFGLVAMVPPWGDGLMSDPDARSNRFARYAIAPPEARREAVPDMLREEKESGADPGKRHAGTSGQMGDRAAPRTGKRYAIEGPKHNPSPRMGRDLAKALARTSGILSYLSAQNAPTSPFGGEPMGADPENALGALVGDEIGSSFGYWGLGPIGTGRGGGGDGEGTIGVGDLDTIGRGPYGRGDGAYGPPQRLLRDRRGRAPDRVKPGTIDMKGTLSKDAIRRTVRRQINQIKFCYEQGLARRADLSGRVAIRFLIAGTGEVKTAAVVSSSLGDAQVEECIARTVRRLHFPRPEDGGVVLVTYPFSLASSGI